MRISAPSALFLSVLVAGGVTGETAGRGTPAETAPSPPSRTRLDGLPGPGLRGLLPVDGAAPARTHAELDLEVESFLGEEVDRALDGIARRDSARGPAVSAALLPTPVAYLGYVIGGPVVVSLPLPGGFDPGAAGAPRFFGISFILEAGRESLRACRAFLETRGEALRTFWDARRGADGEPVSPDLLAAVAQRKSEIRTYPPCRGLVPPAGSPDGPLRSPEGPP